jgi:hypothetical protein
MKVPHLSFAAVVIGLLVLPSCGGPVPLRAPTPISVNGDDQKIEWAVARALAERGWIVEERQPRSILAVYRKGDKAGRTRVTRDQNTLVDNYAGSENLLEQREGNQILIHRNVNNWLINLEKDISVFLSTAPVLAPAEKP